MASAPVTGVQNDAYITELYESYRRNPASVGESWRQFFAFAESLSVAGERVDARPDASLLRATAAAASLVQAIRSFGHFAVQLDPLGSPPIGAPELAAEFHGVADAELARIPAAVLGARRGGTAADVVAHLRACYCSALACETEHLQDDTERAWCRDAIESGDLTAPLTADEKTDLLQRLTEVDGLERFLGRAYPGHKRFSIEGTDMLVPMLDAVIEHAGRSGAHEVHIGTCHRGRLNVLTHILGKSYETLFEEFEGAHAEATAADGSGDVKYHLGARGTHTLPDGREIELGLVPNPSHLEFVNPVLEGVARARQRVRVGGSVTLAAQAPGKATTTAGVEAAPGANDASSWTRDESRVVPVVIHGDAAFPGEGVVAETFNLSWLDGFRTGGTLHLIVNNQVGFTTNPREGRSTYYASDLAKGFELPVVHVNGDDPAACLAAVRFAMDYRLRFGKDALIDLVGYRRHGHNEGDEPAYTQPMLYAAVKQHPTPREVWARRLELDGTIDADTAATLDQTFSTKLEGALAAMQARGTPSVAQVIAKHTRSPGQPPVDTRVPAGDLLALNDRLLSWPATFHVHPRLAKQFERRRTLVRDPAGIDWAHAEALAFASLLTEGVSVRLTGQDAERGTFSQRHAVLHDVQNGETYAPLQHLPGGSTRGTFEVYNSPLSETAVLAFEYGYSTVADDTLVLWEAQYGDFANVAQPIIDQFIVSDRSKWGQDSGLVMLLPHGYEGQGPEHSSARLERFLQLSAEGNLIVAYPSTPAQYFHVLRRQARTRPRRPLVLMQPKSVLRLQDAAVGLEALAGGAFQPVIDDPVASRARESVRRLVLCTGKIFYDLAAARRDGVPGGAGGTSSHARGGGGGGAGGGSGGGASHVAIVRVEELHPWPHDDVGRIVDLYPAIEEVVWAQEEPKNMGAWMHVAPLLRASTGNVLALRYVGRPERASPAEGYKTAHDVEQRRIVETVLAVPRPAPAKRRSAAARS
jgi:2-oxoglutarate dehydrogenase E1 component